MSPLNEISGNRQRRSELTLQERSSAIDMRGCGYTYRRIGQYFGRPHNTIFDFIRRHIGTNAEKMPRSGRPQLLHERTKRHIFREVNAEPKIAYNVLLQRVGLNRRQKRSVQRYLDSQGVNKWRSKRRPMLSDTNARDRLTFAQYCQAQGP